jgi:hypothetical protein
MGEHYILVNDTAGEYIDPDVFPTACGTKHTNWVEDAQASIPAYVLTDSGMDGANEMCGIWAGDQIRLLGSYHDDKQAVTEDYSDISTDVFEEMARIYDWFLDATLGDRVVVSSPEEIAAALRNQLDESDAEEK